MPPAGPVDTPCLFVRISAPWEQEVVVWEVKSEGAPPVVPSPLDPDGPFGCLNKNRVLLDFKVGIPIVMPIGGGSDGHIWIIGGTATYGKFVTEGPLCDYPVGTMPWEQTTPPKHPNYFPKENFKMDILDPRPVDEPPSLLDLLNPLGP